MSLNTWNTIAFTVGAVVVLLLILASGSLYWLLLLLIPALTTWGLMNLMRRTGPEKPPRPLPAPPMQEPATLEGRVERMTVEDVETESDSWKPWESTRIASVFVIVISGLRYTLDPGPVSRGGYDWIKEGMWVRAMFDRKTRVIHEITAGFDPLKQGPQ